VCLFLPSSKPEEPLKRKKYIKKEKGGKFWMWNICLVLNMIIIMFGVEFTGE